MKVVVVGVGVVGFIVVYMFVFVGIQVILYEKEDYVGGYVWIIYDVGIGFDMGFMVFN